MTDWACRTARPVKFDCSSGGAGAHCLGKPRPPGPYDSGLDGLPVTKSGTESSIFQSKSQAKDQTKKFAVLFIFGAQAAYVTAESKPRDSNSRVF